MKENAFWIGVCVTLIGCTFILALLIFAVVFMDYSKDNLQPICNTKTGTAMWFYEGQFARDFTAQEKTRWCPRWTMTPTNTFVPVNSYYATQQGSPYGY